MKLYKKQIKYVLWHGNDHGSSWVLDETPWYDEDDAETEGKKYGVELEKTCPYVYWKQYETYVEVID